MSYRIVVFCLLLSFSSFSQKLVIQGNTRTHDDVVKVEIQDVLEKKTLTQQDLKEIERRIWNLRIFSKVNIKKENDELVIKVEERWTTIPIAKFSGGGGTSFYALGAYDINSFGKNTELGAQYESLNGRPAGVAWVRKPQFLNDRNLRFGLDLWSINRVRFFFDPSNSSDQGALTLKRQKFNSFIEKKWDNDFYTLGLNFEYQSDQISEDDLGDELKNQNEINNFSPDEKSISRWFSAYFQVGRINVKNYLVSGRQVDLRTSYIVVSDDQKKLQNLSSQDFTFRYYKLFENQSNLAWQFRFKNNNLTQIQNLNYLGGFQEVRGYMDGQYYGNSTWQNNIEYRFDLLERGWLVLQGAAFTDQAKEGSNPEDLIRRDEEILLSSGLGIRIISPKIFRFVGRVDYAQTHTRAKEQGISFGIQQFF